MSFITIKIARLKSASILAKHSNYWLRSFRCGSDPKVSAPESTKQMMEAFVQYLPQLLDASNKGVMPSEQASLDAARAVSPGYSQLQNELLTNYGPEFTRATSALDKQRQLAQAETDRDVLKGPGKEITEQALANQRIADPEYFKTRELGANRLADLFNSINVEGLSGSERAEVERSLNRDNSSRGLGETPTATSTVSNAMTFGGELDKKRNQLGQALSLATSFLPASRSGIDTFQQATGRSSTGGGSSLADTQFGGVKSDIGARSDTLAQSFLGETGQTQRDAMGINANRRAGYEKVMGTLPDY